MTKKKKVAKAVANPVTVTKAKVEPRMFEKDNYFWGGIMWGVACAVALVFWQVLNPSLYELLLIAGGLGITWLGVAANSEAYKSEQVFASYWDGTVGFLIPTISTMLGVYYLMRSAHMWWDTQYPYVLIPIWITIILLLCGMELLFVWDKRLPTVEEQKKIDEFVFERKMAALGKSCIIIPFFGIVVLMSEQYFYIMQMLGDFGAFIVAHLNDIGSGVLAVAFAVVAILAVIYLVKGWLWVNKKILDRKMKKKGGAR
jgi:heme/copper-type cytochrome/quinol oxidase subunit 4